MRPVAGDVIGGKYRIVRLIGDGGMGSVFEARHEVLGSVVALKFLHTELARRPGLASRFLQEARVSASIQSAHVTRVTDVDQTPDGAPYLVMELLIGENLQQVLDRTNKLNRDQAVDYALQILSGLEAAHALNVVHRDLKPDNVFVTNSNGGPILKLLDFGIAKLRESREYQHGLTRPGSVMGTPEYMAPEQLYAADRVDHRADLYSLGAILYEMLTGSRPAYGDDATQIVAQVVQGNVKPLRELDSTLPEGLAVVVHRALDPDKNRRFETALAMRIALAPFAGELSHAGRLAGTPSPSVLIAPPENLAGNKPRTGLPAAELQERRASGMLGQGVVGAGSPAAANPAGPNPVGPSVAAAPGNGGSPPSLGTPWRTAEAERPSGLVPPTIPPERGPNLDYEPQRTVLPKGATQEASAEVMQQIASALQVSGPRGGSALPGMMHAGAPQPHYGSYVQPSSSSSGSGRIIGAVLALFFGLMVAGGVILAIAILSRREDDLQIPTEPPATNINAQDPSLPVTVAPMTTPEGQGQVILNTPTATPTPAPTPTPTPKPKPTYGNSGGTAPKDAGADSGGADAGTLIIPFPFPLPSTLRPIPFPTLPSGFPFPFPPARNAQGKLSQPLPEGQITESTGQPTPGKPSSP